MEQGAWNKNNGANIRVTKMEPEQDPRTDKYKNHFSYYDPGNKFYLHQIKIKTISLDVSHKNRNKALSEKWIRPPPSKIIANIKNKFLIKVFLWTVID